MKTRVLAILVVTVIALAHPAAAGPPALVTDVAWTDGAGRTGVWQFQGVLEASAVRGILATDDGALRVNGTLAADGAVSGTLTRAGDVVGSFAAARRGDALAGRYSLGGRSGTWSARAEALPSASGARRLGR